jgi:hypothetical protein
MPMHDRRYLSNAFCERNRPVPHIGAPATKIWQTAGMRIACLAVASTIVLAATIIGVAAQTPALSCHGAQQPKEVAELMFGRDVGKRLGVSEAAWAHFVAREMTPRFPDGLTITDAVGQWRDRDSGTIVREPSKHVEIVLPGNADDDARIDAIVAAYKSRFRQQAVGVIVRSACVSF